MTLPLLSIITTATTIASAPPPSFGLSPQDASRSYDTYAPSYDDLDGDATVSSLLGIDAARDRLFRKASGRVLEIGVGTGLNLYKYDLRRITSLTLVDISTGMIQQANKKVEAIMMNVTDATDATTTTTNTIPPIEFVLADATTELQTRFGTDAFDTVVDSFSLCVMGNPGAQRCLSQMAKVVKPNKDGGRILLLENTRSDNDFLGWYQDLTADAAANAGGKGCVYNQDVSSLIRKTDGLIIMNEIPYTAGLFRSFECSKI